MHRQKIMGHVRIFQMRRARLAQQAARRRLEESPRRTPTGQDTSFQQPVENGSSLHYSPHARRKLGRGSHSVDRMYSSASNISQATEASSISVDSRGQESREFSTSIRFSRYINPRRS